MTSHLPGCGTGGVGNWRCATDCPRRAADVEIAYQIYAEPEVELLSEVINPRLGSRENAQTILAAGYIRAEWVTEQLNTLFEGEITVSINSDGSVSTVGHRS